MRYVISTKVLKDKNLKEEEVLVVLLIRVCDDIPGLLERLSNKGYIKKNDDLFGKGYQINETFLDRVRAALLSNDPDVPKEDVLDNLASKLMELYPRGKKAGTTSYWRGNKKEIREKLQKFYKLYGNRFTDEQIIEATRKYVASFNGNYSYMRVLKYFIIKDEKTENSEGRYSINQVSDLATLIENAGQENGSLDNDWSAELR